ncbi:maltokinase N-terminal cap-like domain-containing protein [Streptomyces sp. NBC_01304]|uniref:maltokinase N-terminal cap-like domain-containing protein n=1 Tax=Streptomyces sp. NBC_01304 TaxID=2903818 RepID=UPI002E0E1271|nr:1,4-alpha-glucan branching protein [Streptomyces sp. NBC_01304]
MAVIHHTTMTPTKLELLTSWLPTRPWYVDTGSTPQLAKAGGFRLDDPEGVVGLEFMVVTDSSGERPVAYHVPMSYRGAPLDGADECLIGTSEHGVLGKRWLYDGTHDPVLVGQLLDLLQGRTVAQAQSVNDTPDPSVAHHFTGAALPPGTVASAVSDSEHGSTITLDVAAGGAPTLQVARFLGREGDVADSSGTEARGHVAAGWRRPDGGEARAPFFVLRDTAR